MDEKTRNKRGQYFHHAIHIPMAEKFKLTPQIIFDLRAFVIHRKMSQEEICLHITENLNTGKYDKAEPRRKQYKERRTTLLTFLLHCSPEDFAEITKLTKWDYDYMGENKLVKGTAGGENKSV